MKELIKNDNKPGDWISGVCKTIIKKLIEKLFTIIDKETASLENKILSTSLTENATLIDVFEPMYIGFDEYLPYSGALYELFEVNIPAHIWCDNF